MYKCLLLGLSLVLFNVASQAQEMSLSSGTIAILPGTSVSLVGPINWTLAPGAVMINDGILDLGTEASLTEQLNAPVTGTGIEQATTGDPFPFVNIEPGNLGLTLTATSGPSPITVVRGHLPQELPQGDQSISRWYQLEPSSPTFTDLVLELFYDPTELNGLDGSNLGLFGATALSGPWNALASTADPVTHTVVGTYQGPWDHLTAFDENAPTSFPTLATADGFNVWPTLVEDVLHIVSLSNVPVGTMEVFDGLGRCVDQPTHNGNATSVMLHLSGLSPGAYFLRVNGSRVFKFRKV